MGMNDDAILNAITKEEWENSMVKISIQTDASDKCDVRKLAAEAQILCSGDRGELSDGYHTFNDLYKHRILLFIMNAKTYAKMGGKTYRFHHYEGWFCLGMETAFGQISYHIPERFWETCDFAAERQPEFDGHTSDDVLDRLAQMIG